MLYSNVSVNLDKRVSKGTFTSSIQRNGSAGQIRNEQTALEGSFSFFVCIFVKSCPVPE